MANEFEHSAATKTRQGWCADPFGRFEQRYWSQGRPTALVRNGRIESRDAPTAEGSTPTHSSAQPIVRVPTAPAATIAIWLHPAREHRGLRRLLLAVAVLAPVSGWILLIPNPHARTFALANYLLLTTAVIVLATMFRTPRRLRCRPRPRSSPDGSVRSG